MKKLCLIAALSLAPFANPVSAQTVLSGNHSVDGRLCAGNGCSSNEDFFGYNLKINNQTTDYVGIYFEQNVIVPGFAMRDWAIKANESFKDVFYLVDVDAGYSPFSIEADAGRDALYIAAGGDTGMGTKLPIAQLHLKRSDSSAKILVEETSSATAARTLFQLNNNGNTKFGVLNTDAGVEWAFANAGTAFRLSRQGSGEVEMEIFNNGDVQISGLLTEGSDVNTKQDIEPVNGVSILEKLSLLEISEWSYKDAPTNRHVGPMAQDFYAAFGLGHTDKGIATLDSSGVALAAIKALIEENTTIKEQNQSLERRVIELEQQNQRIEDLVNRMVMGKSEQVAIK